MCTNAISAGAPLQTPRVSLQCSPDPIAKFFVWGGKSGERKWKEKRERWRRERVGMEREVRLGGRLLHGTEGGGRARVPHHSTNFADAVLSVEKIVIYYYYFVQLCSEYTP